MIKKHASSRQHNRGAALMEALVGILIFAIGIVGIVGLMASMTRAQGSAQFKSEAIALGTELVGMMWADGSANQATYLDCSNDRCKKWKDKVAKVLPGGVATITTAAEEPLKVKLQWTVPGEEPHQYEISTTIAF